jgi:hypothetical protein
VAAIATIEIGIRALLLHLSRIILMKFLPSRLLHSAVSMTAAKYWDLVLFDQSEVRKYASARVKHLLTGNHGASGAVSFKRGRRPSPTWRDLIIIVKSVPSISYLRPWFEWSAMVIKHLKLGSRMRYPFVLSS